MKDKLLLFMIGLLVGAIISTGAFYVYTKTTNCGTIDGEHMKISRGNMSDMRNGEPPERPEDNNSNMQTNNN